MTRFRPGSSLGRIALAGLLLAVCAPLTALAAPQEQKEYEAPRSYARVVRLSLVEGDVQLLRADAETPEDAQLNTPIREGHKLSTGNGRAEIEFESGATVRLAPYSSLTFTELALQDGDRLTQIHLTTGTATFYANLDRNDRFLVRTPFGVVRLPKDARFRVDVNSAGVAVAVLKGEVYVEAFGAEHRITKNRMLTIAEADERVTLARAPEPDEWDRWVADRDEVIVAQRDRSLRYLNGRYSYGAADLIAYGSWYNLPGYGYGWRPYGVDLSWNPYYYGNWHYYHHIGWTWRSHYRWGWLPYHFGGWHYSNIYGWVWFPGQPAQGWCPHRVYFVIGGHRHGHGPHGGVGFGPLSPRDRPGRTPANLPNGTVTFAPPQGSGPAGRFTRADLGPEAGKKVFWEAPAQLGDEVRMRKSDLAGRGLPQAGAPAAATPGGAAVEGRVPAGKFAEGTPRGRGAVAETPPPGAGVVGSAPTAAAPSAPANAIPMPRARIESEPRDGRGAPRGGRGISGSTGSGAPAGIMYDPETRRYVNRDTPQPTPNVAPNVTPRVAPRDAREPEVLTPPRESSATRPGAGVIGGGRPNADAPAPPRSDTPRTDTPRSDAYLNRVETPRGDSPRHMPRAESPRSNAPRYESAAPRSSQSSPSSGSGTIGGSRPSSPPPPPPRIESAPRPSAPPPPPPRMESPRPSSPPPAPRPSSDAGGKPGRP